MQRYKILSLFISIHAMVFVLDIQRLENEINGTTITNYEILSNNYVKITFKLLFPDSILMDQH